MDAPDDWRDHAKLFDFAYNKMERRILCNKGDFRHTIPILNGNSDVAFISAKDNLSLVVDKSSPDIEANVRLSAYFSAPVYKNETLGTVIFTQNGHELAHIDLVCEDNVLKRQSKKGFFSIFK